MRAKHCGARKKQGPGLCARPAGWGTDHPGEGRCKLHGGAAPARHGMFSTVQRTELRALMEYHAANPDPLNLLPDLARLRALADDFVNRYDDITAALLAWHESYQRGQRPFLEDRLLALETVVDELEALVGPADEDDVQMEPEPQLHGGWLRRERVDDEGTRVRRAMRDARKLIADLRAPVEETKPRQMPDIADAYRIVDAVGKMVKRIEDIRAQNAISRPDLLRIMQEMGRVVARYVADEAAREKIQDAWLQIRV